VAAARRPPARRRRLRGGAAGRAQVCYFGAVERLSVGVALLIEYTAPVLLLAWTWARTAARPRPATLLGAGLAIAGLVLVLDAGGARRSTSSACCGAWRRRCAWRRTSTCRRARQRSTARRGSCSWRAARWSAARSLFAVLGAWWLVAQRPTLAQVTGGALVIAAIALIRWAEPRNAEPL
jgi:drug/metabolite transporter (DMT)-like permease